MKKKEPIDPSTDLSIYTLNAINGQLNDIKVRSEDLEDFILKNRCFNKTPDKLRANPDFMRKAIAMDPSAISIASDTILQNDDIVKEAIGRFQKPIERYIPNHHRNFKNEGNWRSCKLYDYWFFKTSDNIRNDWEIVRKVIQQEPLLLRFLPPKFSGDKEIALEAVGADPYSLRFCSKEIKKDKEVVLKAVQQHGQALCFALGDTLSDVGIITAAMKEDLDALNYVNPDINEDLNFIQEVIKSHGADKKLVLKRLNRRGRP